MELTNTTPLSARVHAWDGAEARRHEGMVVAKATFTYTPDGEVALDSARPFPLFDEDERTRFGLMPRDDLPRAPEGFEVILLGSAHAPRGEPVCEMRVSLRVGAVERSLAVVGDRFVRDGIITPPTPFTRMDLDWSRAFGGAAEVLVDRDAPVIVTEVRNPAGRGFNPLPQALGLCESLRAPKGYPIVLQGDRALPNVERPDQRMTSPDDAHDPAGWCTLPFSSPALATRAVDLEASQREGAAVLSARAYHRAVDEWIIDRPAEGAEVALSGLDPDGDVRFALPRYRVACDFLVGDRATTLELMPEALLIVGPWRRFTLLYRARFHFWAYDEETASARLWSREVRAGR